MFKHKTLTTVVGFLLAGTGLLSLLLNLVGVDLYGMDELGRSLGGTTAFVIKILMTMVGFVLITLGVTNWEQEEI
jgi:uncharacterized membrane protein YidH (DUF202 family)